MSGHPQQQLASSLNVAGGGLPSGSSSFNPDLGFAATLQRHTSLSRLAPSTSVLLGVALHSAGAHIASAAASFSRYFLVLRRGAFESTRGHSPSTAPKAPGDDDWLVAEIDTVSGAIMAGHSTPEVDRFRTRSAALESIERRCQSSHEGDSVDSPPLTTRSVEVVAEFAALCGAFLQNTALHLFVVYEAEHVAQLPTGAVFKVLRAGWLSVVMSVPADVLSQVSGGTSAQQQQPPLSSSSSTGLMNDDAALNAALLLGNGLNSSAPSLVQHEFRFKSSMDCSARSSSNANIFITFGIESEQLRTESAEDALYFFSKNQNSTDCVADLSRPWPFTSNPTPPVDQGLQRAAGKHQARAIALADVEEAERCVDAERDEYLWNRGLLEHPRRCDVADWCARIIRGTVAVGDLPHSGPKASVPDASHSTRDDGELLHPSLSKARDSTEIASVMSPRLPNLIIITRRSTLLVTHHHHARRTAHQLAAFNHGEHELEACLITSPDDEDTHNNVAVRSLIWRNGPIPQESQLRTSPHDPNGFWFSPLDKTPSALSPFAAHVVALRGRYPLMTHVELCANAFPSTLTAPAVAAAAAAAGGSSPAAAIGGAAAGSRNSFASELELNTDELASDEHHSDDGAAGAAASCADLCDRTVLNPLRRILSGKLRAPQLGVADARTPFAILLHAVSEHVSVSTTFPEVHVASGASSDPSVLRIFYHPREASVAWKIENCMLQALHCSRWLTSTGASEKAAPQRNPGEENDDAAIVDSFLVVLRLLLAVEFGYSSADQRPLAALRAQLVDSNTCSAPMSRVALCDEVIAPIAGTIRDERSNTVFTGGSYDSQMLDILHFVPLIAAATRYTAQHPRLLSHPAVGATVIKERTKPPPAAFDAPFLHRAEHLLHPSSGGVLFPRSGEFSSIKFVVALPQLSVITHIGVVIAPLPLPPHRGTPTNTAVANGSEARPHAATIFTAPLEMSVTCGQYIQEELSASARIVLRREPLPLAVKNAGNAVEEPSVVIYPLDLSHGVEEYAPVMPFTSSDPVVARFVTFEFAASGKTAIVLRPVMVFGVPVRDALGSAASPAAAFCPEGHGPRLTACEQFVNAVEAHLPSPMLLARVNSNQQQYLLQLQLQQQQQQQLSFQMASVSSLPGATAMPVVTVSPPMSVPTSSFPHPGAAMSLSPGSRALSGLGSPHARLNSTTTFDFRAPSSPMPAAATAADARSPHSPAPPSPFAATFDDSLTEHDLRFNAQHRSHTISPAVLRALRAPPRLLGAKVKAIPNVMLMSSLSSPPLGGGGSRRDSTTASPARRDSAASVAVSRQHGVVSSPTMASFSNNSFTSSFGGTAAIPLAQTDFLREVDRVCSSLASGQVLSLSQLVLLEFNRRREKLTCAARDVVYARIGRGVWVMNPQFRLFPALTGSAAAHNSQAQASTSRQTSATSTTNLASSNAVSGNTASTTSGADDGSADSKHCASCKSKFGWFGSKFDCHSCGKKMCKKCMAEERRPLFERGIFAPVVVMCVRCADAADDEVRIIRRTMDTVKEQPDAVEPLVVPRVAFRSSFLSAVSLVDDELRDAKPYCVTDRGLCAVVSEPMPFVPDINSATRRQRRNAFDTLLDPAFAAVSPGWVCSYDASSVAGHTALPVPASGATSVSPMRRAGSSDGAGRPRTLSGSWATVVAVVSLHFRLPVDITEAHFDISIVGAAAAPQASEAAPGESSDAQVSASQVSRLLSASSTASKSPAGRSSVLLSDSHSQPAGDNHSATPQATCTIRLTCGLSLDEVVPVATAAITHADVLALAREGLGSMRRVDLSFSGSRQQTGVTVAKVEFSGPLFLLAQIRFRTFAAFGAVNIPCTIERLRAVNMHGTSVHEVRRYGIPPAQLNTAVSIPDHLHPRVSRTASIRQTLFHGVNPMMTGSEGVEGHAASSFASASGHGAGVTSAPEGTPQSGPAFGFTDAWRVPCKQMLHCSPASPGGMTAPPTTVVFELSTPSSLCGVFIENFHPCYLLSGVHGGIAVTLRVTAVSSAGVWDNVCVFNVPTPLASFRVAKASSNAGCGGLDVPTPPLAQSAASTPSQSPIVSSSTIMGAAASKGASTPKASSGNSLLTGRRAPDSPALLHAKGTGGGGTPTRNNPPPPHHHHHDAHQTNFGAGSGVVVPTPSMIFAFPTSIHDITGVRVEVIRWRVTDAAAMSGSGGGAVLVGKISLWNSGDAAMRRVVASRSYVSKHSSARRPAAAAGPTPSSSPSGSQRVSADVI